jgi:hydrogenase maturation protease
VNRTLAQSDRGAVSSTRPKRLRVVGCGNPYVSDDGAGLEVVRRLRERWDGSCELLDRPQAGLELLDCMQGAEVILFVDAVSSGAPPGTLHLVPLPSQELEARGLSALSSHGWGLTEALSLMSALGRQTPRLFLLGVEIETLAPGAPRSGAVEAAIRTAVDGFPRLSALLMGDLVAAAFRPPRPCCPEGRRYAGTIRFPPGDKSFPGGL